MSDLVTIAVVVWGALVIIGFGVLVWGCLTAPEDPNERGHR